MKQLPRWGFYALLIYMPLHIFLAQSLSLMTGGLTIWKGAKDAITALLVALITIGVWHQHESNKQFNWYVALAVAYGALHMLVWALNPHIFRDTAILGSVYNNRLLWYLLIGMGVGLVWPKTDHHQVIKLVLLISTLVCLLGIMQYFLPKDILTHLGYSLQRGVKPAFFIDDKPNLPRIMSTLRDPNSLGAFLILPITLLVYRLFYSDSKKHLLIMGLLALHALALLLTFSRSAWLGAMVSVGVFGVFQLRAALKPWFMKYWPILLGTVLLVGSLTLAFRNQYAVKNILVHGDKSTAAKSKYDSNGYHWLYAKQGLEGIWHKPLGHGPGTAGIVSIQNPHGGFLTENYYLQIGYEVGVLGLLLFLAIHLLIYRALLQQRSSLAVCLLASFWGYVLVNMFLHIWSNESVAAQWWLLAGLALSPPLTKPALRSKKRAQTA